MGWALRVHLINVRVWITTHPDLTVLPLKQRAGGHTKFDRILSLRVIYVWALGVCHVDVSQRMQSSGGAARA